MTAKREGGKTASQAGRQAVYSLSVAEREKN
jgi:hypothetical protein